MNILLIGGSGSLINNLIIKLNKEGHRVYLLTGNRYDKLPYQKVFERYSFTYDCSSLNEVFESINPDLTVFMGAYDTNFNWKNEESEAVKYASSVMNILMAYAMGNGQRFIYLSSHEVYGNSSESNIGEEIPVSPRGFRGMVLAQAEEMCENYRKNRGLDIVTLRISNLYGIPETVADVKDVCTKMCLEALDKSTITIGKDTSLSVLYETDAIESIYRVIMTPNHKNSIYHIASTEVITERQLAEMVQSSMDFEVELRESEQEPERKVLSNRLYESEFGSIFFCNTEAVVKKIALYMKKNRHVFLYGEEKKQSFYKRIIEKGGWLLKGLVPFVENIVAFAIFFMLNNRAVDSRYFANLDFYLLYVLLFAIVYGQQQATLSAALAVIGYCFREMYDRTGFEVMLDTNTYVWIAQLFILGLAVGYMRDYITKLKREQETEKDFLSVQLRDIRDINSSNVRVKDALETQIVNQNDSVGKIYSITSSLDHYSPEEVLFYAAEMISKLVKSKDVAIYRVSNNMYARLFSATSPKARELGQSIRYTEMEDFYEAITENKVYINRKLDERYPLMANGIFDEEGSLQMLVMIWSIPWESMTLGQANQLVVISALIQNAVIRANKYLAALEEQRYIHNTKMLAPDAFTSLMKAYLKARKRGLTECVVLRIYDNPDDDLEGLFEDPDEVQSSRVEACLRQSDYIGRIEKDSLMVLLANTDNDNAKHVMDRLLAVGYKSDIVEDYDE